MVNPEGRGGIPEGASKEDGGNQPELELTPEEEERLIVRVAAIQESMVRAIHKWTEKGNGGGPMDAQEVAVRTVQISNSWEQFVVHDLLGVSKERFDEILKKHGYM